MAREYSFVADGKAGIDLNPSSSDKEILQNVITICTTLKGSRPMDREFGISPFMVDAPMVSEQARITNEIVQAVNKYEPRAQVVNVSMGWSDEKASLWPTVRIKIR